MPLHRLLTLLVCAVLVAGCGSQPAATQEFEGQERAIADTVEDIQRAAERREADRICRDFVSAELAERIGAGGTDCVDELRKAIADAAVVELEVQDIEIQAGGRTATARVRGDGERETVREFSFVRGGDPERWRVESFGTSG